MLKHFKINKSLDLKIPTLDEMFNELIDSGFSPKELSKLTIEEMANKHEKLEETA